ncbi:MAG: hypothetical protein C0407_14615 [Desulfobacca sp.]|nr:hypothetical protein [Desulfobacca sp.]
MFVMIVFCPLIAFLIVSSGTALHMAVFKSHHEETGVAKKVIGGIVSYLFSGLVWLLMTSYTFLGW